MWERTRLTWCHNEPNQQSAESRKTSSTCYLSEGEKQMNANHRGIPRAKASVRKYGTAWAIVLGCLLFAVTARAQNSFNSGSTGADGAFAPTTSQSIAVPTSGTFNFTTVNIPSGVTITFTRNSTNSPLTILASGDVVIAGNINIDGQTATANGAGALGGPGGSSGGAGGYGFVQSFSGFTGGGAGGGVRLIANTLTGTGTINASGGGGGCYQSCGGTGGQGYVRIEAYNYSGFTGATSPTNIASLSFPHPITPPNSPSLRIASVGGVNAPASPGGSLQNVPDVIVPSSQPNPVTVALEGANIPVGTV